MDSTASVFGDYGQPDAPFHITCGHSKDKRPDLKQFPVEMFRVDRDVPIIGAARDGNASDKTLNNELLGGICHFRLTDPKREDIGDCENGHFDMIGVMWP
jgi:hypothetical protein